MIRTKSPLQMLEPNPKRRLSLWHEALVGLELLLLHGTAVYYGLDGPRGDGSAVILIPGFLANDVYLMEMYAWLRRIGYRPFYSGIRINADCPNLISQELDETITRVHRETGGKVHLIGHSLGGIIARSLAARRAGEVASVITLGSPFRGTAMHPLVTELVDTVRRRILENNEKRVLPECYSAQCACSFLNHLRKKMPSGVAQTAVYTRLDGLMDWQCCVTGSAADDFEVTGTHLGLAFNATAYRIIAHRLADPTWHP